MTLAADRLRRKSASVALCVGYESEADFRNVFGVDADDFERPQPNEPLGSEVLLLERAV